MKDIEKYREEFNVEASENNNYIYTIDEQDYDLMNEMFSKLTAKEKAKSKDSAVTFDERLKRYELDKEAVQTFTKNAEYDRDLKKIYGIVMLVFLAFQLIAFNVIFFLTGLGNLYYDDEVIKFYVTGGLIEIFSLVTIILKYLFKDNTSKPLNDILEKNKKNK